MRVPSFNANDILNKKFGKLFVEKFAGCVKHKSGKHNVYYYLCKCDCGNKKQIIRTNLIMQHTTSCGCLKKISGNKHKCWNGFGEISGAMWNDIKTKALSRQLVFDITIEDAWNQYEKQNRKCALTGWEITIKTQGNYRNYSGKTASLDRINNDKGYTVDNIQWVHKEINWMKGKFAQERFKELCKAVSNHMEK